MRMKVAGIVGGLMLFSLGFLVACTNSTSNSPGTASGATLLVTSQGDSAIESFTLSTSTGALTAVSGAGVATGTAPFAMLFTPAGDAAFVSNAGSNNISSYTVNGNGALTAGSTTSSGGTSPMGMAIDGGGHFLFVANQGTSIDPASGTVSVFSISSVALTLVGTTVSDETALPNNPPISVTGPVAVAVTPDAKFLYVANQIQNTVSIFSVDATGALTRAIFPATVGTSPSALAISSNGKFLYVANSGSNNVQGFSICGTATPACLTPDGTLTEVTGSPISTGLGPSYVAISSTGNFAYVVDQQSNQLSSYKVNVGSGLLTATTPVPAISTGLHPSSVVISSGEQFVYVANTGANTISQFTMDDTTGALTVVGTPITSGAQPTALALR
jgi:6-phosphogluconolactonase (cycloisomerase 2 family)